MPVIDRYRRSSSLTRKMFGAVSAAAVVFAGIGMVPSVANAANASDYFDLPLTNRDAGHGPGGVNPELPTDRAALSRLVDQARVSGASPSRYAALLFQFRLVDVTEAAGIDLANWNPRAGVQANRDNLVKSYRFYEDLQLSHRELQWAGMAGLVGADFGGGLIDFELAATAYVFPELQRTAAGIVSAGTDVAGPALIDALPEGLAALARAGGTINGTDLHEILGRILVMQKNIFSDLMPMHQAYVTEGLPALEEMQRAGLFGEDIMNAWRDVASLEPDRIAHGNAVMLQREQGEVIREQWDDVRGYKGDVGQAITYLATLAGAPSVAGVVPPRSVDPIEIGAELPDGRHATLTTPLPSWNWSVYDERWSYITSELLPKYKSLVENDWPRLEADLRVPYETQLELHRPLNNIPQLLESALRNTKVTIS